MTELWEMGKANSRLSPFPTAPWKSRQHREIPTFPQLRRRSCPHLTTKPNEIGIVGPWKSGNPTAGFPLSHRPDSLRQQGKTLYGNVPAKSHFQKLEPLTEWPAAARLLAFFRLCLSTGTRAQSYKALLYPTKCQRCRRSKVSAMSPAGQYQLLTEPCCDDLNCSLPPRDIERAQLNRSPVCLQQVRSCSKSLRNSLYVRSPEKTRACADPLP